MLESVFLTGETESKIIVSEYKESPNGIEKDTGGANESHNEIGTEIM